MFGAINVDLLATASEPAAQDDSTPGRLSHHIGGVGHNIALNLHRLGVAVSLVSAVGDDQFGDDILSHLKEVGIDGDSVSVVPQSASASYTAIHNNNGDLLHAIADMDIFEKFELPSDLPWQKYIQQLIQQATCVVVDANLPQQTLAAIAEHCDATSLIADGVSQAKCTKLKAILPALSLIKLNRAEATMLGQCSNSDDQQIVEAIHELGVEQVLLSAGEAGVMLSAGGMLYREEALRDVDIVSTSGAGDALLSAVIAARLGNFALQEQLQWGVRAAAHTLSVYPACSDKLSRPIVQS